MFALHGLSLPTFQLSQHDLNEFAKKNNLERQGSFDWVVNENKPRLFLFKIPSYENKLPQDMDFLDRVETIFWFSFRDCVKKLELPIHRHYLQLAVQYISSGGIMDNVIASDYDLEFLRHLKEKLNQGI